MTTLQQQVLQIGTRMAGCNRCCSDVVLDRSTGCIPRCLYLETGQGSKGCIVVGLNPGQPDAGEAKYYRDNNCTYKSVVEWWENGNGNGRHGIGKNNEFYCRIRLLLQQRLGLNGSILWTELVKCHSVTNGCLSAKTVNVCAQEYLSTEVHVTPTDWPMIAVGRRSYNFMKGRWGKARAVVGVYHPTGNWSRAKFDKLLDPKNCRQCGANTISDRKTIWLPDLDISGQQGKN